jgi:hypothetical protein
MSVTAPDKEITLGNIVTLSTTVGVRDPETGALTPEADSGLTLFVRTPEGAEQSFAAPDVVAGTEPGFYYVEYTPPTTGLYRWRWVGDSQAQGASEGSFTVASSYVISGEVDLTDLKVLVPRARRYIEGPYGPPSDRPPLSDDSVYAAVADACADIILVSGNLFGHKLIVKARDPTGGFPVAWQTDAVLEEWEAAVITTQVALNYFFFLLRELKTSESIKNEGSEWEYTLSANVVRDYLKELQARRDLALEGLMKHHPVLDRFASIIRVRDQATVAILEWWSTNAADSAPGLPGGQEAAVIPWTPGWSGPGFTP